MAGVSAVMKSCQGRGTLAARSCVLLLVVVPLVLLQVHVGEASRDDITRQDVYVGENITLKCFAKPDHLLAYRWVYIRLGTKRPQVLSSGRTLIIQEPRFSLSARREGSKVNLELTLSDIRSHESGLFMCWRQGQKPDPQVVVTVLEQGSPLERQVITHTDSPEVVQYGEAATFSCYIQPAWPVRVNWLKDGRLISWRDRLYTQTKKRLRGNGEGQDQDAREDQLVASLFVASVRRDATFTCRIETNPPEEQTMLVTVRVPRVESLTAEPDKDVVEYGQPLTLTCVISGSDSEVVWLKDGSELVFGPDYPGRRKHSTLQPSNRLVSTVQFEAMSFADNGQYVCYIPGASRNILINIEGRPPRLLGVTGNNFYEDEELTLRCTTQYARNAGTKVSVTWTFEGAVLDPSVYESLTYPGEHNTTIHQLTLSRASARNIGTYQCMTPFGSAQMHIEMYIPPSLREPLPSEVRFKEDEFFRLPCHTTGHPLPSVLWEKKTGDTWVAVEGSLGDSSAELTFPRASASDAGTYRCVARSDAGSFLAEVAAVIERGNPEILEIIAPESVPVGENFTVQCTIRNWEGEVEFTLNGASLMSSLAERFNVLRYPMEERLMEAFLVVRDAKTEDSGQYMCSAGSQASSAAPVLVKEPEAEVLGLSTSAAVVGRDLNITCVVNNWSGTVTFVFNNEVLEPEVNGWKYTVFPGVEGDTISTHVLSIPAISDLYSGRYECRITPSAYTSLTVTVLDTPEVTLELQDNEERNWRDAPTPIACKIKGISPDVVTVLFSHKDTPQVSIQNRTKMSTSSQLVNVAVSEGQDGDEPLTIFTLGFYSLSKEFEGLWTCEVFLPSGEPLSKDSLYLEIHEPPQFVNPPPAQVFEEEGSDLRLNCSVSGPPETMVAWYRLGIQEPIVFDQMSAVLFIPRFTTTDEGEYLCRAAAHGREIQTKTNLTLGTPQPRVESVVASPAVVGQDFSVTCTVSNWNREVLFFHNKESLDFGPGSRYSKHFQVSQGEASGQQHLVSHTLTVANAALTDSGVVECFLTTEIFGAVNVTVEESLNTLPTPVSVESESPQPTLPVGHIVQLSGPESVSAGSELVLVCLVSPTVQQDIEIVLTHGSSYLYVGGIVLAENPRVDIVADEASDGSRILYLRIVDVGKTDEGMYQCATSTAPPAYSSLTVSVVPPQRPTEIPVEVRPTVVPTVPGVPHATVPPTLETEEFSISALEGEDVTFTCRISAIIDFSISESDRKYFIKWTREVGSSRELISQDDIIFHIDGDRMTMNTAVDKASGTMRYDLTLRRVQPRDSGVYACSLTDRDLNPMGYREILFSVQAPVEDMECEFPPEWQGEWYDTRYRQISEVSSQEFKRSTCVSTFGENFIIQHKRRQCYRCVYFSQKHQNLLQYKITKCRRTHEALCSSLDNSDEFIDLVRLNTAAVHCPFTGPRRYTVDHPQQQCDDDSSLITSTTDSTLKFQYPSCWLLSDPSKPASEEFECVADWAEGSTRHLIARLFSNSSQYLEQLYRCFTYTQARGRDYAYIMTNSESPTCGDTTTSAVTYKISQLIGEAPPSVTGLGEWDISVQSSEVAVLPCRASVLIGSDDPTSQHVISWVREVDGESDVLTVDDQLLIRGNRHSLDMGVVMPGNTSKYDLIIFNVQPSDAGAYSCVLRHRKGGGQGVSHSLSLTVAESPGYEECVLPVHWSGEWWASEGSVPIGDGIFGGSVCEAALGDKFLMRGPTCNTCYIIREMHFNLLYYKKSPCERSEDLNTLCSMIEEDDPRQPLVRQDVGITCPFPGSRSFMYRPPHETCAETHSQLIFNDTQLLFLQQPCHPPTDTEPDITTNLVQCVAIWSEGSTHYLMAKVNDEDGYHCFTFEEAMNQDHLFVMGQAQSEVCADLRAGESTPLYRIFGESKAPETPIIEGDEASRQVLLGDAVTLTCSSRGGVPPPTLKWFRVVDESRQELASQTVRYSGVTKASVDIVVEASDKYSEYHCEASNFATLIPLNTSANLTFRKDYASIMVPQVVVVEYQPAFLPCARTLEDDIQMEWFDVDLELKVTSGNTTVIQDPAIVPYIQEGVMGLMITSSFLDTTFGCFIDGVELGNTSLIIYPKYLVLEESQVSDPLKYFMPTTTKLQPPLGHSATLDCSLADSVNSTLVSWWRYPGTTLLTQGNINFAEEDGYTLDVSDDSYRLTVSNATLKHSGLYICQVALNEVELYRRNFSINVEGLITTQLGEDVAINCYSPGGPVTFIYSGEDILLQDQNRIDKYILERSEESEGGAVYTLIVTNVTEEDFGVYTCIVAGHSDHVLQETSVSILGEEVTTLMTTTREPTTTESPTTELTTVTESITTSTTDTPEDTTTIPTTITTTEPATTSTPKMFTTTLPDTTTTTLPDTTTTPWFTTTPLPTTTTPFITTTPLVTTTPAITTTIPTTVPTTTTTTTTTTEAPSYRELILSCKGHHPEFISWKYYNGTLMFLGTIDIAGVVGTRITTSGDLVLTAGPYAELRDNNTYTCYLDSETDGEVPVVIYQVTLDGDDAVVDENLVGAINGTPQPQPESEPEPEPLPDLEFSGLKEEEVALLANSKRIGHNMKEVLERGGLNVRLLEDTQCRRPNETRGWAGAKAALEECEAEARFTGDLGPTQSVFIGFDFFVELVPSSWFAVTQLYVNNVEYNVSVNVFAPMVPVPSSSIIQSSWSDDDPFSVEISSVPLHKPVSIVVSESWWNTVQGVDNLYTSGLSASILSLQESYISLLEKEGVS